MSENGVKTVEIPATVTVRDLAEMIDVSPIEVIKQLMANGVMANINQQVDFDTAAIVIAEFGFEAEHLAAAEDELEEAGALPLWRQLIEEEDPKTLKERPPVVTVLGHVDHGKTTLLDAIRPGHAAFTSMRARGAKGADIAVLVVAADDGVMPQTREALAHVQAARVPIIVALNKIDRPNSNPDKVKQELSDIGLIPDDWEGETMVVPVSAKEKDGLEDLLEAINLVADSTEIKANPSGKVIGMVIEAELDKAKGVVATFLVQNGTLRIGDAILVGTSCGKIRAMFDFQGEPIKVARPSQPVSVMGLSDVPLAGELFTVVESEREARIIVEERKIEQRERARGTSKAQSLEQLFAAYKAGEVKELRLVVKADVQGSLEPIVNSLEKLSAGEIKVNILHAGTGNISENDVMLAAASQGIVIGFNVTADQVAKNCADVEDVDIRVYDIIYRLTEDIELALKGMLEPETRRVVLGKARVRAVFRIPKLGNIAGCIVTEGEIQRSGRMLVLREDEELFNGPISSLRHEKDDVREIRNGFECGIGLKGFESFKEGDILECFTEETVPIT
jgi:translation initiation factor IF-2